jgi:hypothetical protein
MEADGKMEWDMCTYVGIYLFGTLKSMWGLTTIVLEKRPSKNWAAYYKQFIDNFGLTKSPLP